MAVPIAATWEVFAGYQQEENRPEKLDENRIQKVDNILAVQVMAVEEETEEVE